MCFHHTSMLISSYSMIANKNYPFSLLKTNKLSLTTLTSFSSTNKPSSLGPLGFFTYRFFFPPLYSCHTDLFNESFLLFISHSGQMSDVPIWVNRTIIHLVRQNKNLRGSLPIPRSLHM